MSNLKKLFLIFLALPLAAQIRVSPSSISLQMEAKRIAPTPARFVNITGIGASLTVSCANGTIISKSQTVRICDWFVDGTGTLSSSSAPSTLGISLAGNSQGIGWSAALVPAGPYTATLTVTAGSGCVGTCSQNVSMSLMVTPGPSLTVITSGNLSGCATTNSFMFDNPDVCAPINAQPGGTQQPPAPGSSFVDTQLGWTIRGASPAGYVTAHDANVSDINSNNTYLILANALGAAGDYTLVNAVTGASVCDLSGHLGSVSDYATWSPLAGEAMVYYSANNNQISKHVITITGRGRSCSVTDNPGSFPISVKGTTSITAYNQINRLGYWAFIECLGKSPCNAPGTSPTIALINLNKATVEATYNFSSDLSTYLQNNITYPRLSKGASNTTGRMYIWIDCQNGNGAGITTEYSTVPGSGVITADGPLPNAWYAPAFGDYFVQPSSSTLDCVHLSPASCLAGGAPHGDTVEAGGHEWYVIMLTNGRYLFPLAMSPDIAGIANMGIPTAFGGGSFWSEPIDYNISGYHLGCAVFAPVCVLSTEGGNQPIVAAVKGASGSGSITVTFSAAPPFTTGQSALFGGVGGCTGLNGQWPGASVTVSGSIARISGASCRGTYTSGGYAVLNKYPGGIDINDQQIMAFDFTNIMSNGLILRKGANSYSVTMADNVTSYFQQPHATISMRGTLVDWESNFGVPGTIAVYAANTGYHEPF